jgi:hypothetical protein
VSFQENPFVKKPVVFALAVLISSGAVAQSTVHVQGKVVDPNGNAANGAQIVVTDTNSKQLTTTVTDKKGKYSLDFLPQGKDIYSIAAKQGTLESAPQMINARHADQTIDLAITAPPSPPQNVATSYTSSGNILQNGTPVRLVLKENLSSKDATVGQEVVFNVIDDVIVNGRLLIAHGALAKGTVTVAQAKRRMGKAGKLNVNIDYALMTDGEHAALRAVKDTKGDGRGAAVTTGVVATAIVFFPAAPLFLLMHGKDIDIPEGTEITAFINGDIRFNPEKFEKVPSN